MSEHPTPVPARTPTQEEIIDNRDWALQTHSVIVQAIRQTRADLWQVAKQLHEWDERRGWKWTGNYETVGEWLADPEVAMTKATYYRLLGGYRTLVLDKHVPEAKVFELESSKVDVVMRAIKANEVDVNVAISDVEVLSKSDLIEKYNPPKPTEDDNGASPTGGTFDGEVIEGHEPVEEEEEPLEEVIEGSVASTMGTTHLLLTEHVCGNRWWGDEAPEGCSRCSRAKKPEQAKEPWKVVYEVEADGD